MIRGCQEIWMRFRMWISSWRRTLSLRLSIRQLCHRYHPLPMTNHWSLILNSIPLYNRSIKLIVWARVEIIHLTRVRVHSKNTLTHREHRQVIWMYVLDPTYKVRILDHNQGLDLWNGRNLVHPTHPREILKTITTSSQSMSVSSEPRRRVWWRSLGKNLNG